MKKVKIWALCMIAAVVSFLGFVVENLWMAVTHGTVIRWEILINSRIHRKIKRKVL